MLTHIFHPFSDSEFSEHALQLFHFQYDNNDVYREFCRYICVNPSKIQRWEEIPFLPISFFKTHKVITTDFTEECVFHSSGTTTQNRAKHYLKSLDFYKKTLLNGFKLFYGNPEDYAFLALLPNYMQNPHSSLICMVDELMKKSGNSCNDYFLDNHNDLYDRLLLLKQRKQKTILFGVSYALLDFIQHYTVDFPELIVFETGGMKGRKKEMVKEELHQLLKIGFGVDRIDSEYGMCELMSQAYSRGNNCFSTPPWMKIVLRDEKNPLYSSPSLKSGFINVIDFANLYSASFIATDDLGKIDDFGFQVIGRGDNSQIRGCNLLII